MRLNFDQLLTKSIKETWSEMDKGNFVSVRTTSHGYFQVDLFFRSWYEERRSHCSYNLWQLLVVQQYYSTQKVSVTLTFSLRTANVYRQIPTYLFTLSPLTLFNTCETPTNIVLCSCHFGLHRHNLLLPTNIVFCNSHFCLKSVLSVVTLQLPLLFNIGVIYCC